MRGLLNQVLRRGVDSDAVIRPSKIFTPGEIGHIAERACREFRNRSMNVLSIYGPLDGPLGVYETLQNFVQNKSALTEEIMVAVQSGDEMDLLETMIKALEFAFVSLNRNGALDRLCLTQDAWPTAATAEWLRMELSIAGLFPGKAPAAPEVVEHQEPVAPVVVESPVETCAREFKEMPSAQWKKKWLLDQRNGPVADLCVAEGRI
jgi:hypothetical protein